jgi:archaellum component FlaC
MNEVKKSIQYLDEKFNNLNKKFSEEIEILKKQILEVKTSTNQIKNSWEGLVEWLKW